MSVFRGPFMDSDRRIIEKVSELRRGLGRNCMMGAEEVAQDNVMTS